MSYENVATDLELKAEIKLFYDLSLPETTENAPLLIAVHGYGAHKRYMMREAKLVASAEFAIASVQAPHQHFRKTDDGYKIGFGWLTDFRPEESVELHQKFLLDLIEKLSQENGIDKSRVYLYGFSQACALNFRFAFTHPESLRGLIGVCGGIPGDLDTNANYKPFHAETIYLYGDDDEFYPNEKFTENAAKLDSLLPNFTAQQFPAKHEITEAMRERVRKMVGTGVR